jgi:type III restriction enzyme
MLPRFVIEVKKSLFFGEEETCKLLDQEDLMKGFRLTAEDKKITFTASQSESQMITLDERNEDEWVPMAAETPAVIKNDFFDWFSTLNTTSKVKHLTDKIAQSLERLDNIDQGQIVRYVYAVLEETGNEELTTLAQNYLDTVEAFENKIKALALAYRKEKFRDLIDTGEIRLMDAWSMPEKLTLTSKCPHLAKMLYTEEDYLNNFEYDVIKKIASLPNVRYWHKNLNRRPGF